MFKIDQIKSVSYVLEQEDKISFEIPSERWYSFQDQNRNSFFEENKQNDIEIKESVKYYKIFFNPIFFIVSIATFLSYFCWWYMQPVMSLRLEEFDLSIHFFCQIIHSQFELWFL